MSKWHIHFKYKGKAFTGMDALGERTAKRVATEMHRTCGDDVTDVGIIEDEAWVHSVDRVMAGDKWNPR